MNVLHSVVSERIIPFSHFEIFKKDAFVTAACERFLQGHQKVLKRLIAASSSHWPTRLFLRLWLWILLFSLWHGRPAEWKDTKTFLKLWQKKNSSPWRHHFDISQVNVSLHSSIYSQPFTRDFLFIIYFFFFFYFPSETQTCFSIRFFLYTHNITTKRQSIVANLKARVHCINLSGLFTASVL